MIVVYIILGGVFMVSKNVSLKTSVSQSPMFALQFVSAAEKCKCNVTIRLGTSRYNAKSIIGTLASCFSCADGFEVICDGSDEAVALEKVTELFKTDGLFNPHSDF